MYLGIRDAVGTPEVHLIRRLLTADSFDLPSCYLAELQCSAHFLHMSTHSCIFLSFSFSQESAHFVHASPHTCCNFAVKGDLRALRSVHAEHNEMQSFIVSICALSACFPPFFLQYSSVFLHISRHSEQFPQQCAAGVLSLSAAKLGVPVERQNANRRAKTETNNFAMIVLLL